METNRKVRVRFAPSPTGYLHIGGVRTALFNWLFARHHKGTYILRIEDTDQTRSTEDFIQNILEGLKWLGLNWDEGPFRQTERAEIYKEHVKRLVLKGKAYRCYCTPEELQKRRDEAIAGGRKPKYDGRCRDIDKPKDMPFTIRFRTLTEGKTSFTDLIHGEVSVENSELDDLVILRSDGTPTYNLVVVVDDAVMGITHVIRGDDHLPNTPRQINLYKGLGYPIPKFAHLPMILGADKTRLSKRHGATAVLAYRDMGYLPEAVINYLARLGWSCGNQEIFSIDELIEKFDLANVGSSAAVFNPDKLLWLNSHYIKTSNIDRLTEYFEYILLKEKVIEIGVSKDLIRKSIPSVREKCKTMIEMAEWTKFFLKERIEYEKDAEENFLTEKTRWILDILLSYIEDKGLDEKAMEMTLRNIASESGESIAKIIQPVRVALTGRTVSAGIFDVIRLLEKDRVVLRLKEAIAHIDSKRYN